MYDVCVFSVFSVYKAMFIHTVLPRYVECGKKRMIFQNLKYNKKVFVMNVLFSFLVTFISLNHIILQFFYLCKKMLRCVEIEL